MRQYSTNKKGKSFSEEMVQQVWEKGEILSHINPRDFRSDKCGKMIQRNQYGKQNGNGWEIDHIFPVDRGGLDDIENLQPLAWKNNRGKSNSYPNWTCISGSAGTVINES